LKIAIYLIAAAVALGLGLFIYLSIDSKRARETGLLNGKLRACQARQTVLSARIAAKIHISSR
jgi:hypothetical protein